MKSVNIKEKGTRNENFFFLWGGGHQWMAQWCFFNQNQAETMQTETIIFSFSLNCLSKRRQDPSVHSFLLEITRGGSTFPAIYSGRGNRDKGGNQNFWGHKGGQNQKWKFWICIKTLNQVKIWFANSLKKTSSGNLFRGLKSQPITILLTTNGLEDTNPGEVPTRFKGIRLTAIGSSQRYEVDFDETFAPVSRSETVRAALCLMATPDMDIIQIDIKTAFRKATLQITLLYETTTSTLK